MSDVACRLCSNEDIFTHSWFIYDNLISIRSQWQATSHWLWHGEIAKCCLCLLSAAFQKLIFKADPTSQTNVLQ